MIDRDVYTKLSDSNAKAIQGLEPKINYWVTGDNNNNKSDGGPIGQIFRNLPPLIDTIYRLSNCFLCVLFFYFIFYFCFILCV
jgi:flotillin